MPGSLVVHRISFDIGQAACKKSPRMNIDSIDRRILDALQRAGRMSNADLSERVHLSPSACHRRVQRLEAEGYIATIKSGKVTFRDGEWTGETPGGLIRGPQRVELLEAAE